MVYDLIAKIWPESDPVYDLTAIDTRINSSHWKNVLGLRKVAGIAWTGVALYLNRTLHSQAIHV